MLTRLSLNDTNLEDLDEDHRERSRLLRDRLKTVLNLGTLGSCKPKRHFHLSYVTLERPKKPVKFDTEEIKLEVPLTLVISLV